MPDLDLSRQLYALNVTSQNGAEIREPIIDMLEAINNNGGNVYGITDGNDIYTWNKRNRRGGYRKWRQLMVLKV